MAENESKEGKEGNAVPLHGGNADSGEKQQGVEEGGGNVNVAIDAAVVLFLSADGRVGFQLNTGIPTRRIMVDSELPGFLMQAALALSNMAVMGSIQPIVEKEVKKMWLLSSAKQAPKPEAAAPVAPDAPETPAEDGKASEAEQ